MESKKLITILVAFVVLVIAFLGAVVVLHERQVIAVNPDEYRAEAEPAPSTAEDPAKRDGGSAAEDPRVSIERRLRLFAVAGHIQRGRIVHSIREKLAVFRPHILKILHEEDAGLLEPDVLVAGRLELEGVEIQLFELMKSEAAPIRAAAIRALGYMRRWTKEDAAGVLASESDPKVLRAALEATLLLAQPPIRSILPLLAHLDWGVVRAARRAMPDEMSEEDVTRVSEWTRSAKPSAAVVGIQVLGALDPSPARDRILVEHSTSKVWSVQLACLDSLARDAGSLPDTGPIWRILEDPKSSLEIKVHAFLVLEKTRTVDVQRIRRQIDSYHPVVKLAAARCLLVEGDRDGLRVLVDLLSTVEGPEVDDEDCSCAIEGAQELLVEVSKQEHGPDPAIWGRWYRTNALRLGGALDANPRLAW